jgi:hypothetical protein
MDALIRSAGRTPLQRTMRYQPAAADRREASYAAPPLAAVVQTPLPRRSRSSATA